MEVLGWVDCLEPRLFRNDMLVAVLSDHPQPHQWKWIMEA